MIKEKLLPLLSKNPPDIEAMRLYLTLPWCHLFTHSDHQVTVAGLFAEHIVKLEKNPSKIIGTGTHILAHLWGELMP